MRSPSSASSCSPEEAGDSETIILAWLLVHSVSISMFSSSPVSASAVLTSSIPLCLEVPDESMLGTSCKEK